MIVKDFTDKESPIHMVFKNGHLSDYHRHNDDLSIHLTKGDKVIFGDGGLYSHNKNDIGRRYAKSAWAHSTVFPEGPCEEKITKGNIYKGPKLNFEEENQIKGQTWLYYPYAILNRQVSWNQLDRLSSLEIEDTLIESQVEACKLHSCFIIPSVDLNISHNCIQGIISFTLDDVVCEISYSADKVTPFVEKGLNRLSGELSNNCFVSNKMGVATPSVRLNFEWLEGVEKVNFTVNLKRSENYGSHHNKQLISLSYRGYKNIEILEDNWFFDDRYPNNVCHHIMSLRWVSKLDSEQLIKVITAFIKFHSKKESEKGKNYLGRLADHTASIRLNVLLQVIERFSSTNNKFADLVRKEIIKTIKSCLSETYKNNNNHGLMVDKAILDCLFSDKQVYEALSHFVKPVVRRMEAQIDGIFDQDGYCKEHSISYQEYNLGIVLDLLKVMQSGLKLGFDSEFRKLEERVDRIKSASKKALGFLLKDDETYFTVGDSFSEPKPLILEEAYGFKEAIKALRPYSEAIGTFISKTLGLSVYRSKNLHLVLNGSWHSYVHKQNDDLNFFIRANGEDIFVESGYSDLVNINEVNTRSEYLHSTVIPKNTSWKKRSNVSDGYSYVGIEEKENLTVLRGSHSRTKGLEIRRTIEIEKDEKFIRIEDSLSETRSCMHRFIIPNHFEITEIDGTIFLKSNRNKVYLSAAGESKLNYEKVNVKTIVNNEVVRRKAVDFLTDGFLSLFLKIEKV